MNFSVRNEHKSSSVKESTRRRLVSREPEHLDENDFVTNRPSKGVLDREQPTRCAQRMRSFVLATPLANETA